ncbi:NYN domain-containing protein [Roseomonas sp. 18066]|uniref:NYN domain-containing protein n=1 Tax=Roseomonas sp. 18066 TaxID=2681412 RepID=UPI001358C17E|nr:NYN domain-containing protein [Roseomonas sp. 18066]
MHLAYVDCSNLFIEAQKVSAVSHGLARNLSDARDRHVTDFGYRLDLHRLMALLQWLEQPVRAVLFGSITLGNAALWRHAEGAGFEVMVVERAYDGREKQVDTSLVTRLCRDAYAQARPDHDRITLVAGDGDYLPAVQQLVADGFDVTLAYWAHASRDLREAASRFQPLDPFVGDLALS